MEFGIMFHVKLDLLDCVNSMQNLFNICEHSIKKTLHQLLRTCNVFSHWLTITNNLYSQYSIVMRSFSS